MEHWALAAYSVLATIVLVHAALMLIHTWENRRFARGRMRALGVGARRRGKAAIIAPCKGLDVGFEDNLRALFQQDYRNYELVFVVESPLDPACAVIRRVIAEHTRLRARIVFAGRAAHSGQKVHNLQAATAAISADVTYLAFVDGDARPRRQWLRSLVDRLSDPKVGAVTGYRWFVPEGDTWANWAVYSINCGVALLLGHGRRFLVWGGSWAMRRRVFEALDIRARWEGTLSDDLVVTRVLRQHGLQVQFEPACMIASPLDMNVREALAFLQRQYQVGRFYARGYWLLGLVSASVVNAFLLLTVSLAAAGWIGGQPWTTAVLGTGAAYYVLSVLRCWVRQDLVSVYFPYLAKRMGPARRFDLWAAPLAGMFNWLGLMRSLFRRRIVWRGINYWLDSDGRVRAVGAALGDEPAIIPITAGSRQPQEEVPNWFGRRKAG